MSWELVVKTDKKVTLFIQLERGWANSGPRAKCGPPQRFQWPVQEFRRYVQI